MQEMKEKQIGSLGWEDPPGGRNGNPIQYSCLENPMDRGAWQAAVHGVLSHETEMDPNVTLQSSISRAKFNILLFFSKYQI